MPKVRLSGKVSGVNDPNRAKRADILYKLFLNGWDIYNGNGDQSIHLENIQKKIQESQAFVFPTNPDLEDYFNLASLFVGYQTLDNDLKCKKTIIINDDNSWQKFFSLIDNLIRLGTIGQDYRKVLDIVGDGDDILSVLNNIVCDASQDNTHHEPDILVEAGSVYKENSDNKPKPKKNICIFCSASIKKKDYLEEGYQLGKILAANNIGCISGAGKTGIMGEVVRGSYENGGWSGGSNVPHIIQLEGLPDGLDEFWPRADIYTRMLVMIEKSDAFIIMPGGMGTIQELLALLLLKQQGNDLTLNKPIYIYNKYDQESGVRFWQPLIELIKNYEKELISGIECFDEFGDLVKTIENF